MDTGLQYIPVLIFGFAASLGLTPLSRQIAMRLGVVDKPNLARKTHIGHKPMMGGLAIYVAFALSLLLFSPAQHIRELLAILVGSGLLAVVGLLDDRYDLSWRVRLAAYFLAAVVPVLAGIQIRLFGSDLIDVPLTLIWVVALTNATNFLDNMDGLTAGLSTIAAGFFLLIAIMQGQILVSLLAAALVGSAIGFLVYNFNPSSTFMGDMGSLLLGFILAIVAIKLNFSGEMSMTWLIPVMVLILPIFDITLVVFTRLAEGRSPAEGGHDHTSHRTMALGFSPRQTLFILYGLCVIGGVIGTLISILPPNSAFVMGLTGIALFVVLYGIMIWIRERYQKREQV